MKKFKSVLVFLLSLIIVFSAFPSTVFAESSESYNYCTFAFRDVYGETTTFATPVTMPHTYVSEHMQRNISNILVEIKHSNANRNSFKADDAVSGSLVLSGGSAGRYTGFSSIRVLPRYVTDDGIISGDYVSGKYNPSTSTVAFDFSVSQDCKGLDIQFYFNGISVNSPVDKSFAFTVTSCDISVQSSHEGLLNTLYNYFSELFSRLSTSFDNLFASISNLRTSILKSFDNVKIWFNDLSNNIKGFFSELGTKLSDGFTSLTNSIKDFFTNLGNNLKDWFDDVGQWFKDIGDRIGDFFSSLWDNISDSISSITTAVSDWWQSVKDFFHSLFVPEDGFFDSYKQNWENWAKEHFGLFFDVKEIFEELFYIFDGSCGEYGITIPEIKLPFFNNPVIVPRTVFYFSELIAQHSMIKRIYDLFQIMFSVIVYGLLLVYLQKTFSKILTNDEEAL